MAVPYFKFFIICYSLFICYASLQDTGLFLPEVQQFNSELTHQYKKRLTDRGIGQIHAGGQTIINWAGVTYRHTNAVFSLQEIKPMAYIDYAAPALTPHTLILVNKDGLKIYRDVKKDQPYQLELNKVKGIIEAVISDYDQNKKIKNDWAKH